LAGTLFPIKVQDGTWFATYVKPKKTPEAQKVMVRFTVDETEKDATLDFITSASITFGTAGWYSEAPIDVIGFTTTVVVTTTVMVIKMKERFGPTVKNDIVGLVVGDFTTPDATTSAVFNVTDSANVALSSVTVATVAVSGGGTELNYTLTMGVAQTSADVIAIDITKTGLDMRDPLQITIP